MGVKNLRKGGSYKGSKLSKPVGKQQKKYASDSEDSDSGPEVDGNGSDFFSSSDDEAPRQNKTNKNVSKKTKKHAPTESSWKKPVSVVRPIPGLTPKQTEPSLLYQDVRFETALGKADYKKARKQYSFLDEYREQEIESMEKILKDKEMTSRMSEEELKDLKYRLQSTRSRLEALRSKDRESVVLKNHMKETGKAFIKRSDQRKLIQKDRFEHMSSSQRTKAMERKRKRKLGKEMRALEHGKN